MPLTDVLIRNPKPSDRPIKLFDDGGLYLLVGPNGARGWRLKYRLGGREKMLSLGVYPEISLEAARDRRDQARSLVALGPECRAQGQTRRARRHLPGTRARVAENAAKEYEPREPTKRRKSDSRPSHFPTWAPSPSPS
jgi:hypothetical protein